MMWAAWLETALILSPQDVPPPPAAAFSPPGDPRIRMVSYQPDEVIPLTVTVGYAAVVEFGEDERIENVVLGETSGWQITPNHSGNRIVVKPVGGGGTTNMVVVTDSRRYVFLLGPSRDPGAGTFAMRFAYEKGPPTRSTVRHRQASYRLRGDKALFPTEMTDDNARTTVTWNPGMPLPAIFAIDDLGHETLVNARMVGTDYVIEGTARRYALRRGRDRAIATRRPVAGRP